MLGALGYGYLVASQRSEGAEVLRQLEAPAEQRVEPRLDPISRFGALHARVSHFPHGPNAGGKLVRRSYPFHRSRLQLTFDE